MLQKDILSHVVLSVSVTTVKSFYGQIVHLQLDLHLLFHFSPVQYDYKSIMLFF